MIKVHLNTALGDKPLVNVNNPKNITDVDELMDRIDYSASAMRNAMTMAYGLAHYTCLEANDNLRKSPLYKHRVKGAFKNAMEEHGRWEHGLLYSNSPRFFHVADMKPESRRIYKADLTDKEFLQMWLDTGAFAYDKYKTMVGALRYKYEKVFRAHGEKDSVGMSWAIIGCCATEMAQDTYATLIDKLYQHHGIPKTDLLGIFGLFNLKRIYDSWLKAAKMMFPQIVNYQKLDGNEKADVQLGLDTVFRAYADQYLSFDSTVEVMEDSEELFATKGMYKKQMRIAMEENEEFKTDMEKRRLEERLNKRKDGNKT